VCPIRLPLFLLILCVYVIVLCNCFHPSSIWCQGSNPWSLDHEPSALTTRPWLSPESYGCLRTNNSSKIPIFFRSGVQEVEFQKIKTGDWKFFQSGDQIILSLFKRSEVYFDFNLLKNFKVTSMIRRSKVENNAFLTFDLMKNFVESTWLWDQKSKKNYLIFHFWSPQKFCRHNFDHEIESI
jgi:hypothetical protein